MESTEGSLHPSLILGLIDNLSALHMTLVSSIPLLPLAKGRDILIFSSLSTSGLSYRDAWKPEVPVTGADSPPLASPRASRPAVLESRRRQAVLLDSDSLESSGKGRTAVDLDSSGRRVLPWASILDEAPTQPSSHTNENEERAASVPPASTRRPSAESNRPLMSSSAQSSPKPRNVLLKKNSSRRKAGRRGSAQSLQAQSAYKAPRSSDQADPASQSQSETPERWSMVDVPPNVGHMGISMHEHRQSLDGTHESGDSVYTDAQAHHHTTQPTQPNTMAPSMQPATVPAPTIVPLADADVVQPDGMLALGQPMLPTSEASDQVTDTGYAALPLRDGQAGRRGLVVQNSQALTSMHGSVGFAGQSVLSLSSDRPRQSSGPDLGQRRSIDRPRHTSGLSEAYDGHSRNTSGQEPRPAGSVVEPERTKTKQDGAQEEGPGELGRLMREGSQRKPPPGIATKRSGRAACRYERSGTSKRPRRGNSTRRSFASSRICPRRPTRSQRTAKEKAKQVSVKNAKTKSKWGLSLDFYVPAWH